MRIVHALSFLLVIALVALLAGCSSGGGGGTPTDQVGTVTIYETEQKAVYTSPTSRTPYSVYAYCTSVDKTPPQTVSAVFGLNLQQWNLDLSSDSTQFNGSAIGTYDMAVWVIFADDLENPARVGPLYRVELEVIGNGPPPPPWP